MIESDNAIKDDVDWDRLPSFFSFSIEHIFDLYDVDEGDKGFIEGFLCTKEDWFLKLIHVYHILNFVYRGGVRLYVNRDPESGTKKIWASPKDPYNLFEQFETSMQRQRYFLEHWTNTYPEGWFDIHIEYF